MIFIAIYTPVFIWLVKIWLNDPYYSHGFLILPVAALIAWTKRKVLVRDKPSPGGVIVFTAGLAAYVTGFIWQIYWLWALSFLIVIAGLLLYLGGTKVFHPMVFPLFFLIFMIPFPFLDAIGIPLQSIAAGGSAWIVKMFGIPVTQTGAEIYLPGSVFKIGIPCSGMNTLVSLLALSTLLLYCMKSPFPQKAVLFILVFPIAILANILRIVLLLIIAHFFGADTAMTYFHDYSSLVLFILAIALLIFISRLFKCKLKTFTEIIHGQ